jgi:hypothetical protein
MAAIVAIVALAPKGSGPGSLQVGGLMTAAANPRGRGEAT